MGRRQPDYDGQRAASTNWKIPPELEASNLSDAPLGGNALSGEIPPETGQPRQPDKAVASTDNHLSGEIPPELGSLSNLTWLALSGNQLSGEIPPELGNLSNLTKLAASTWNNQLSGEIPAELGGLSNLTEL